MTGKKAHPRHEEANGFALSKLDRLEDGRPPSHSRQWNNTEPVKASGLD
jgi:hypothetical protein